MNKSLICLSVHKLKGADKITNLFFSRTIEELKKFGNIRKLRKELKELLGSNVKIKTNSWQELLKSIDALKNIALFINNDENKKDK